MLYSNKELESWGEAFAVRMLFDRDSDLTRHGNHGTMPGVMLGIRLMVGQRSLEPYVEVRILDPQPGVWFVSKLLSVNTPLNFTAGCSFLVRIEKVKIRRMV